MSKTTGNRNIPLTVEELTENVKKMVRKAYEIDTVRNPDEQVLVGRNVKHAFMVQDGEHAEKTWYIGRVISQVPGFPSWFNIKYSGDRSVYSYELLRELKNGDLKLLL
ncbi:SPI2A-like protein [Mya arenaria]|uniref:SPI2A-like protein n=1 Tax=Mya arenaria TaxID=6604 RepID=A0ABY7DKK9_MYAAR|nr:SPI2A-like protein [Mya arenaria]